MIESIIKQKSELSNIINKDPEYKQWVENEFTKYFLDNKEYYIKERCSITPTPKKEYNKMNHKLHKFYKTLKSKIPEMAKKYKVEKEDMFDEITYWLGAYKHGQLDALDDILGTN